MNTKYFFLLLFSSLIVLHGCKDITDPEDPDILTLADFLENNKPSLQEFHVTAGTASTIQGAKGCTINFGVNSFYTMSGTPVTSGDIEIHLREVTNKKDMVLSQTPTVSDDELLVSQGVYYLKALQNGFELQIVNFRINKTVETQTDTSYAFVGGILSGEDSFNWFYYSDAGIGPPISVGNVFDSIIPNYPDSSYYQMSIVSTYFYSQNFNWINCDYFYNNTAPRVAVFFPTTDTISVYFFQSYLVFNDLNAVLHYNSYSNNQLEFFNIPAGLNATLFTYYIVGGKAFVATADIVTSDALSTPITFTETTEQGLLDILDGL